MKVIVTSDREELARLSARFLLGTMLTRQGRVNLAITGGATPVRAYEILREEVRGNACFDNVHYYNFDEIPHKKREASGITISGLRRLYFDGAGVGAERIHVLDEKNWQGQDERIAADGGLDLVFLGIGEDGHFCGNLPGATRLCDKTVKIRCDAGIKKRLARLFEDADDMPDFYVTMGPLSIMQSRALLLAASGKRKADIMRRWFESDIDAALPASILKAHPALTVILDADAASKSEGFL